MNNDYLRAVKDIASKYSGIVKNSGVFSREEEAAITRSINDEVMPLLNFEKPKILVYGIYNSGKSTLVNAICRRKVAEVANRPMTWKVDEYDAGKYILIDSPGIDAPQEHEIIADEQINSCHIILFVMSSEGGCAQGKNFAKMLDLIRKGLPFIIVINDWGVPDDELEEHLRDLNSIKTRIIKNLKEQCKAKGLSTNNIDERYYIVVLNAQDAWYGVSSSNEEIITESRISELLNLINQHLEGKDALKNLLAPLSALERKINDGEKILTAKTAGEDYAQKRETLQKKISQLARSFQENLRYSAGRHSEEIYQGYYLGERIDMGRIYNDICSEAEDSYKQASAPIIDYIHKNFSALGVKVDDSGRVTLKAPESPELVKQSDAEENLPALSGSYDGLVLDDLSAENISKAAATGAAAGAAIGSVVPVIGTAMGATVGGILGGAAEFVRELFGGSAKREREEYERRRRENEAYNRREELRIEEEQRRRQSARMATTNQVNAIIEELRTFYGDIIDRNFNAVIKLIDEAISRVSRGNAKIRSTIAQLEDLRGQIQDLRRQIAC